jgi:hypothetical protein
MAILQVLHTIETPNAHYANAAVQIQGGVVKKGNAYDYQQFRPHLLVGWLEKTPSLLDYHLREISKPARLRKLMHSQVCGFSWELKGRLVDPPHEGHWKQVQARTLS